MNRSFFSILGLTPIHSGTLGDIEGIIRRILGSYKSDKPVKTTGIEKIHLKCDCINGSNVNGTRESILYPFTLNSPPGHKICKKPLLKLFKKMNKPVLSHITFYLEDDDHKPVEFNEKTITFTCQLIKIQYKNELKY